jgi:surface polysaccharide O-acyltransferase-like enzyme
MEPARESFLKTIGWSMAAGLIAVILYAVGLIFLSVTDTKQAQAMGASPQLYFYVGSAIVFAAVSGLVLAVALVRRWRKKARG